VHSAIASRFGRSAGKLSTTAFHPFGLKGNILDHGFDDVGARRGPSQFRRPAEPRHRQVLVHPSRIDLETSVVSFSNRFARLRIRRSTFSASLILHACSGICYTAT